MLGEQRLDRQCHFRVQLAIMGTKGRFNVKLIRAGLHSQDVSLSVSYVSWVHLLVRTKYEKSPLVMKVQAFVKKRV